MANRRATVSGLLLPLAMLLASGSEAFARTHQRAPPNWETEIRKANDQEVASFLSGNEEALSRLWASDFLVTNPLNKVASKAQVLAMVHNGMLSFKSYARQIETVRRYGEVVVVVGHEDVEWAGKMPLAGRLLPLRFTAVWHYSGTHWLQVARHANVVPTIK